mgnify:CR=1 FL=1
MSSEPSPRGHVYVLSAPSGAGKTSLVNRLLSEDAQLRLSVSHTTRPPRSGEQDGRHYHFVSPQAFRAGVEADRFLEHANVFGHYYGTTRAEVERYRKAGFDVLLEIDWQGASQVRSRLDDCSGIFIVPPSLEALRERLEARGQDSAETIAARMRGARDELSHFREFDYLVVNDRFEQALSDLQSILRAGRLGCERQQIAESELLATFDTAARN